MIHGSAERLRRARPIRSWSRGRALARSLALGALTLAGLAAINLAAAWRAEKRHPPRGAFVTAHDIRLHYLDCGPFKEAEGKAAAGDPAIVLIHGNGAMAEEQVASGLVERLARDHRVIVFDRPGSGYSEGHRGKASTAATQGALLREALRRIGIAKPVLVGHSWGSLVALSMALEAPQETAALVLIAGPVLPHPRRDVELVRWIAIPVLGSLLIHTIVPLITRLATPWARKRVFAPHAVPPRFHMDYPQGLLLRSAQLRAIAWDTLAMIPSAAALAKRYPELAMPVTIIAGTQDKLVPSEVHSKALHAALPGSAYHEIGGAGHMVHYTATDAVAAIIREAARPA